MLDDHLKEIVISITLEKGVNARRDHLLRNLNHRPVTRFRHSAGRAFVKGIIRNFFLTLYLPYPNRLKAVRMLKLPCFDWRGGSWMQLMAHAFFDDADTTHQGASILIMAGFVAGDGQWQACCAKWQKRLGLSGLSHMHAADFLSGNGEVRALHMTREDREDLARQLLDILADNLSFGVAIGVDHQCMKALLGRLPKQLRPTPYSFVIHRLFRQCLDQMRAQGYAGPLYPTFDDSEREAQGILGAYHLALRQNPELRGEVASICFADDRHVVPVQAADLLACASLRHWRAKPEGGGDGLLHHLVQRCPFVSELWDAAEIGRREAEFLSAPLAPAGPRSR